MFSYFEVFDIIVVVVLCVFLVVGFVCWVHCAYASLVSCLFFQFRFLVFWLLCAQLRPAFLSFLELFGDFC